MNPETALMNEIQATLSQHGRCFRANVGSVRMANGRYFSTGLPKGFSDLFGVRDDGKAFFVEVKTEKGRVSKDQSNFIRVMQSIGALAGVARSTTDALEIIERKNKDDCTNNKKEGL